MVERRGALPPARRLRAPHCLLLLLLVLIGACTATADSGAVRGDADRRGVTRLGNQEPSSPDPAVAAGVREAGGRADRIPGATVGLAVLDRESGRLVVGERADEIFSSASIAKLFVASDVATRRAEGLRVSEEDAELVRRALSVSDDEAMNGLWERFDGPGAIDRISTRFGLTATAPPTVPGDWGGTRTSARDVVTLLAGVADLPADRRAPVLDPLDSAPRTAAEGFDQGYGLKSSDRPEAVKAGWMCCEGGRRTVHSAGLIGRDHRYAVALLSSRPSSVDYSRSTGDLTEVAEPLLRRLG
ncbi:serine hydrolase [Saccharopolyspora sp. MS10]|uniref:serine hydrolase n=1 Tax=Saccharopolyspora sp. MS10 TaxID=3385973 RepID=UPI0039A3BB9C